MDKKQFTLNRNDAIIKIFPVYPIKVPSLIFKLFIKLMEGTK